MNISTSLALLAMLAYSPAHADTIHTWANGASYVQISPTDKPGAVAVVEFANELIPGQDNIQTISLDLYGFTVSAEMVFFPGDIEDEMHVTPPDGFIAVPPWVSVPEGESRAVTIYTHEGTGM